MKRTSYKKLSLIWVLILVIVTTAWLLIDIPAANPGDLEGFQTYLDQAIPKAMKNHHIPGVAIGLIYDGKIVSLKGYGFADAQRELPVTENTVFQAASISKSLTAWGIMNLVEEGKLDLDEPVSKYLTRWQLPPSKYDARGVTIRRLLSHSAGIAHVGGYAGFLPGEPLQTLEESLTSAKDAHGNGVSIVRQPGTRSEYSGGGFTLLQLVIEEVTQLPFEEYMQEKVLAPLGMDHSSFTLDPAIQSNLSTVYDDHGKPSPSHLFTARAAAGLYTTAQDLSSWAMAMLPSGATAQGGGVLQPETLQEMFIPQTGGMDLSPYGLGYMVQKILFSDLTEVYHTGTNLPGWNSVVATIPDQGAGLVLLTNSSGGGALRHQIHSAWLYWMTGSSTLALKIEKLVNILMWILPVGAVGALVLLLASKIQSKIQSLEMKKETPGG